MLWWALNVLFTVTASATGGVDAARAIGGAVGAEVPHLRQSIDLQVPAPPRPVRTAAGTLLVYELHITNFAAVAVDLTSIAVLDAAVGGHDIREFHATELADLIGHPGAPSEAGKASIAPGARVVVYVGLTLDGPAIPLVLGHRVEFDLVQPSGREHLMVQGVPLPVNLQQPIAIGPPLRGGPWVAIYDPSANRGHRRVIYAVDGRARIPGRFAVDWMKVNGQGQYAHDDDSQVANWYGYGAEVLAVANARVADSRDGLPESATVALVSNPLENASGNYVSLELGHGFYAFYEHLMPGSVFVKAGDHVKRGQVIARLGYTGDSTGPHLHFHISDANSPLGAEGQPFVIDHFNMLGNYESLNMLGQRWTPASPGEMGRRSMEFPTAAAVVDLGGTP